MKATPHVISAEAGIQTFMGQCYAVVWIPASAGMTSVQLSCMFTKTGFVNSLRSSGTQTAKSNKLFSRF